TVCTKRRCSPGWTGWRNTSPGSTRSRRRRVSKPIDSGKSRARLSNSQERSQAMSDSARTRFLPTPADDALAELEAVVADFVAIDTQRWPSYEHLHHAALSAVHAICLGVLHCEESGCTRG